MISLNPPLPTALACWKKKGKQVPVFALLCFASWLTHFNVLARCDWTNHLKRVLTFNGLFSLAPALCPGCMTFLAFDWFISIPESILIGRSKQNKKNNWSLLHAASSCVNYSSTHQQFDCSQFIQLNGSYSGDVYPHFSVNPWTLDT